MTPHDALLASLDLTQLFGDAGEVQRLNEYGARLAAQYPRTDSLREVDPDGKQLCIDLTSLSPGAAESLDFSAVGCHGTLSAKLERMEGALQLPAIIGRKVVGQQRSVGDALRQWHVAKKDASIPSFGFLLGDNFYESGLPKSDAALVDAMFEEGYHEIYNQLDGRSLDIPYFGLLGNHDYNLHGYAITPREGSELAENMTRALAEVDYGYRVGKHWHMPYRYYAVTSSVADFFVLDTSTFLFDPQQRAWLETTYACLANNGKWKFLMGHHGLITFGKRDSGRHARRDMAMLTRTHSAKVAIERHGGVAALGLEENVNRHLFAWFGARDMHFHVNVAAHDHCSGAAMLTYEGKNGEKRRTYFVLAGGGGAALSGGDRGTVARLTEKGARVDLLEKKHGFATFHVTRDRLEIDFLLRHGSSWKPGWERPMSLERGNTPEPSQRQ